MKEGKCTCLRAILQQWPVATPCLATSRWWQWQREMKIWRRCKESQRDRVRSLRKYDSKIKEPRKFNFVAKVRGFFSFPPVFFLFRCCCTVSEIKAVLFSFPRPNWTCQWPQARCHCPRKAWFIWTRRHIEILASLCVNGSAHCISSAIKLFINTGDCPDTTDFNWVSRVFKIIDPSNSTMWFASSSQETNQDDIQAVRIKHASPTISSVLSPILYQVLTQEIFGNRLKIGKIVNMDLKSPLSSRIITN